MEKIPAVTSRFLRWRFSKKLVVFIFLLVILLMPVLIPQVVRADLGAGGQGSNWVEDAEVTEVGRGAERARELLWWVFNHPGIHTHWVLAKLWSYSLTITVAFVIFVIVAFGFGLILAQKKGTIGSLFSGIASPVFGVRLTSIFVKLVMILIYALLSYVLVLAFIQLSDIVMKFFIENIGGKDLFNVIFSGSGNVEANYTDFVGFKDAASRSQEMVNTSLFLVRFTSFTYYVMSFVLILRTIILWFLLIIAPFLAILMPFVFIRNIGWVWIGVFFQWLFYGPLFALFLGGLIKIWDVGIPYQFNFSKTDKAEGQVYRTAINILYGGPAQRLSPGNSGNYVDTFAEYVISLIMLWAVILLPWLLLRIFRDYCCGAISAGNALLNSILDRLRQLPTPAPASPTGPTTSTGIAMELPFRSKIEEKVIEVNKSNIENIKNISQTNTQEIARAMNVSVSSLSDVSKLELDQLKRGQANQELRRVANPDRVATSSERQQYSSVRNELQTRASVGDSMARVILAAGSDNKQAILTQAVSMGGQKLPGVTSVRPQINLSSIPGSLPVSKLTVVALSQPVIISGISQRAGVSTDKVKEVLKIIPTSGSLTNQNTVVIAQKAGVTEEDVKKIIKSLEAHAGLAGAPKIAPAMAVTVEGKTVQSNVSFEDYEEVKTMWLNHYRNAPVPVSEKIKDRQAWLLEEETKLTNISNELVSSDPKIKQHGFEQVSEILPFLLMGGFTDAEILTYVQAKLKANKQVQTELEVKGKTAEEVKKQLEEEATLVDVPLKKEEAKSKAATMEQKMDLPQDKKEPSKDDKNP